VTSASETPSLSTIMALTRDAISDITVSLDWLNRCKETPYRHLVQYISCRAGRIYPH